MMKQLIIIIKSVSLLISVPAEPSSKQAVHNLTARSLVHWQANKARELRCTYIPIFLVVYMCRSIPSFAEINYHRNLGENGCNK